MTMAETVEHFLRNNETSMLDFLRRMIAIKSPSAQEKEMAECVFAEMKKLGYQHVRIDGTGNVIGELGQGEGSMLLSAHMDTAGVADPSQWSHPPYEGKIDGGRIYGRGAGDNKGALAAMVYGAKLWSEIHGMPGHRVLVGATVLEEDADGYGMQALLDELPRKPALVMVGKPTNGSLFRGHRGRMEVRIDIRGKGCHASTPEKGDNALYTAARVLAALEDLAGKLPDDPFLGKASLAATVLEVSPGKFNMVPDEVMICVDRRLTAGETIDSALEGIRGAMPFPGVKVSCHLYQNKAWTGKSIELEKYFPSWVLPEEHPAVKAAIEAGSSSLGRPLSVGKWTVSTDGVGSMGRHGIPTVGYGPGERRVIDDHQEIGALLDAVKYYGAFCSAAGKLL
ncbi:MAG: YgeY family selenium metabolism-linked hydrolase [Candidatus Eremiobacteraeota bacterium]|nr:YgeY family selenium metabolism-linked hydrolase [Candidatus Eremiobacteraeota bacterium]